MTVRKEKLPDFEQCMAELEALIERLERGDLTLEESLKHFERGVTLARSCQTALKAAEQKVEILLKPAADNGSEAVVQDFESES
jgi:exodeoxyribonuclease VII small subunit